MVSVILGLSAIESGGKERDFTTSPRFPSVLPCLKSIEDGLIVVVDKIIDADMTSFTEQKLPKSSSTTLKWTLQRIKRKGNNKVNTLLSSRLPSGLLHLSRRNAYIYGHHFNTNPINSL